MVWLVGNHVEQRLAVRNAAGGYEIGAADQRPIEAWLPATERLEGLHEFAKRVGEDEFGHGLGIFGRYVLSERAVQGRVDLEQRIGTGPRPLGAVDEIGVEPIHEAIEMPRSSIPSANSVQISSRVA